MKRILQLVLLLLLIIFAIIVMCSVKTGEVQSIEPFGSLQSFTVKEKSTKSLSCGTPCTTYYVTFEKNGQMIKLKSLSRDMHEAIQEGTVVDVDYDSQYTIIKLNLTDIEKEQS